MRSTRATSFRLAIGLCAAFWSGSLRGDDVERIVLPVALQTPENSNKKKPPDKKAVDPPIPEASNEMPLPRLPLPEPDRSKRPQESKRNDPPPGSEYRPLRTPANSTGKKSAEQKTSDPKAPEASKEMPLPRLPSLEADRSLRPTEPKKQEPPEASTVPLDGDSLILKIPKGTDDSGPASTPVIAPLDVIEAGDDLLQQTERVGVSRIWPIPLDARVRAFNSAQLHAVAGGVPQRKTRIDIDPLFSHVDSSLANSMTVLDGPYTSMFGPAFAFVIADLQRPMRFDVPQGRRTNAFGYESNGTQLLWRDETLVGGPAWGFFGSFGQRVGNDYTPGGDSFRIPSSYNQWDGFGSISLDVGANRTLELFYLHNEQNDVELPGVAYDLRQSANQQFSLRYSIWECDRVERIVLQTWATRTRYRGDDSAPSKQATFSGQFIGVPFGPNNNAANGLLTGLLMNGGLETFGARSFIRFGDHDGLELFIGVDGRMERSFYRESDFAPDGALAFGGNVFGIPQSSASSVGAFVHLAGRFGGAATIATGGRVDAWQAGFDDMDSVVSVGNPVVYPTKTFLGTNEPRHFLGMGYLNLTLPLSEVISVTAGGSYAMRPPTLAELYSDQPWTPLVRFGNSFIQGDSGLNSERLLQVDFGMRCESDWLTLCARGFAANVDDYILYRVRQTGNAPSDSVQGNGPSQLGRRLGAIPVTDDAQASYQYANLSQATLLGGDLTAEWRPQPWCTAFASLAYVKGINEDPLVVQPDGASLPKDSESLPGIAPLTGVVGLRLFEAGPERYGVELTGRLVASQDELAESLGELSTPGYTVWNIRAWLKVNDCLTITSGVRNIFNADYTQHGSLAIANPSTGAVLFVPEPGVSWATSVEVRY